MLVGGLELKVITYDRDIGFILKAMQAILHSIIDFFKQIFGDYQSFFSKK